MPLFEGLTPEIILKRILARLDPELQTREGSYAYDLAAPIAFEIWRVMMTLDELVDAFYVDENSGPYLDTHARLLALERRTGVQAGAQVRFFGAAGARVPAGTAFFTASGLEYRLEEDALLQDGSAVGQLRAAQAGARYNVPAGEIGQLLRTIPGLERFESGAAEGGTDPESDAALFARLDTRRKRPPASGNADHYREWAMSIDGVGAARVTRLWAGPGTVRVLLLGYDRRPADQTVVDACAAYIETQRPVGAQVTVAPARAVPVNVSARVTLAPAVTPGAAQTAFAALLDEHLAQIAFEDATVCLSRIGALLLSVDGVVDYSGLTLNGVAENLTLTQDGVPVRGEVTLT